jgi:tetratricopeptide (TPR) repeat protein
VEALDAKARPAAAADPLEAWLARPRREALAVTAVVILAILLRAVHVWGSRESPLFDAPQMDALYHVEWARAWAAGERFQPAPFFRAPLYPWFLGVLTWLFGQDLLLPRLVQAALGASSVLAVWAIGRRAFDRVTALIAALLLATNWVAIFFDGELLLEVLAIPLSMLGIWLSLGLTRLPKAGRALAAGLAWGLSAITRPNVLLLMPLLFLWVWRRGERGLRAALLLTLGVLLPILPITIYNAVAGRDFVLVASQAGINLWIGNNPRSDGSTAIVPDTREDWWGGHQDAIAQAELAAGRTLKPSEVSRHFSDRALDFVRTQPGAWAKLMLHKLRLFSWNAELGNNEEPLFLFERFSPLAPLRWIGFGVLAPLALAGLWLSRRGAAERLPLWGYLLVYSLSVIAFFVNARFRLPIVPALCVYAAVALTAALRALRARRWKPLLIGTVLVLVLGAGSHAVPRAVRERARSNGHLLLATAAAQRRDWTTAERELQLALSITPGNWIARRALGITLRARGDLPLAESTLREVLRERPADVESLDALADLLLEVGRPDEVLTLAEELQRAAPHSPRGPYALGRARFARQDLSGAAEAFRAALESAPEHFGAAYSLGITYEGMALHEQAAEAFELALRAVSPPDDERFLVDAYRRAVLLRKELGQLDRARETAERMRVKFPEHPATTAVRAAL